MTNIKKVKGRSSLRNLFVIAFLFLSASACFAQSADYDFSGSWKTDQGPLVEISKSGDSFSAINKEHNKTVLEDLKYEDNKWTGILIKPKDGSKYNCTVTVSGNTMKLTVKKGLMSKTLTWVKQ